MSHKKMKIFGVGPLLALFTILYLIVAAIITNYFKFLFIISWIPDYIIYTISGLLLFIGVPFFIVSLYTLLKGFAEGELITKGVYGISRNPMYTSFICFIVPALTLLSRSWLLMTTPIFMYFVFTLLIKKEEATLERVFGQKYIDYKEKVSAVLPIIKIKHKKR